MTAALSVVALLVATTLPLIVLVQMLYLEAMRLRARELPALEFFKDTLEEKLGWKLERGALAYSLIKHSMLVVLGLSIAGLTMGGGPAGWISLAEAVGASLGVMLLAAYIIPQLLYRNTSGHWLAPLVPALRLAGMLTTPVVAFFDLMLSLTAPGKAEEKAPENGGSSEEFEALMEAGADEGLIEEDDRKLMESVYALGEKTVREVMTARPAIVAIQQESSIEHLRSIAVENNYSRIPVYGKSIDDIVGFVHVRDLVKLDDEERAERTLSEFVRPVPLVPEMKPVVEMFREMQQDGVHMAIVVDEYGATAGLVTMEDVMEEVFGEIRDEHDEVPGLSEESRGADVPQTPSTDSASNGGNSDRS